MGITFFYLKFVHEGCITSISRFPPQQLRVSRSMFDDFCVSIPCLLVVTPHDFPPLLDVWRTRTIRWFPALSSSGMQSVSPLQAALGEKVLGVVAKQCAVCRCRKASSEQANLCDQKLTFWVSKLDVPIIGKGYNM